MKHVLRGGNGLAKLCVQECMPNATYTVTFSAESSSSRDPLPFHPMRCAKPDPVESKGPVEAVVPVVIVEVLLLHVWYTTRGSETCALACTAEVKLTFVKTAKGHTETHRAVLTEIQHPITNKCPTNEPRCILFFTDPPILSLA